MSALPLLKFAAGPALATLAGVVGAGFGLPQPAIWTAVVTTLCAVWWLLEPIDISATSIIPFAVFPLVGVLDEKQVANSYGHPLVMLLMGGFMLSTAMSASGAHRRVAIGLVRMVGGGRRRLVLGFMIATAFCSMWISNTATVLMLLPVALAAIDAEPEPEQLASPLLIGLAWAASIGGMGTPIGTPPNIILMGAYQEATGIDVGFLDWMQLAIPIVVLLIPLAWLILVRPMREGPVTPIPAQGAWRRHETRVLIVFGLTAAAWVFRTAPFGGWSGALGLKGVEDATVAFLGLVLLFVLPSGDGRRDTGASLGSDRLLCWHEARKVPWGLLILFGGGIAIAKAFETSGLGARLGEGLTGLGSLPVFLMVLIVCLAVTFLTEVTSNTATTALLMPILAAASIAAGVEPSMLMVPAAISASCAFMLPVATAPNAIIYGTDRVPIRLMARRGLVLNVVGAVVISVICTLMLRDGLGVVS